MVELTKNPLNSDWSVVLERILNQELLKVATGVKVESETFLKRTIYVRAWCQTNYGITWKQIFDELLQQGEYFAGGVFWLNCNFDA